VGDWHEQEGKQGQAFPTFARLLARRGTPEADSDFSWTLDFTARRNQARAEMAPYLAEVERLQQVSVTLREQLAELKKAQAADPEQAAVREQLVATEKAMREAQAAADAIDAATFDLKAVNLKAKVERDTRSSAQIIESIADYGRQIDAALLRLRQLTLITN
jgi:type I restriction enzyme M protein